MGEYLKFWLAQYAVAGALTLLAVLGLLVSALWSLRGQKFYKESKAEKTERKRRESYRI